MRDPNILFLWFFSSAGGFFLEILLKISGKMMREDGVFCGGRGDFLRDLSGILCRKMSGSTWRTPVLSFFFYINARKEFEK